VVSPASGTVSTAATATPATTAATTTTTSPTLGAAPSKEPGRCRRHHHHQQQQQQKSQHLSQREGDVRGRGRKAGYLGAEHR
jgi:hypothetical protein